VWVVLERFQISVRQPHHFKCSIIQLHFASQRDLYIPCSAPGDLGKFADCLGEVARKRDLYGENFERLADEIIRKIKSEA
jgi:hypothetical protein